MQARRFPQLQALLQYPSIVLQEYAPRPFLRAHARLQLQDLGSMLSFTARRASSISLSLKLRSTADMSLDKNIELHCGCIITVYQQRNRAAADVTTVGL